MPIRPACRKSAPTSTSSISASSRRTATIRGRALPTGTSASSSRFAICKEAALPALRGAGALRPQEQMAAVLQRALQDDRPRPLGLGELPVPRAGARPGRESRLRSRLSLSPAPADHRQAVRAGAPGFLEIRALQAADRVDRQARAASDRRKIFPSQNGLGYVRGSALHRPEDREIELQLHRTLQLFAAVT